MATLNDKIKQLERQIRILESKVIDLTNKTEATRTRPESRISQIDLGKFSSSPTPSSGTGLGQVPGYVPGVIWNDADVSATPFGEQPPTPTKGYNKHFHSRYAGGALDINSLELVEYEDLDTSGHNRNTQSYWKTLPNIALDDNGEQKISSIADNTIWDKENKVWRFLAVYAEDEE